MLARHTRPMHSYTTALPLLIPRAADRSTLQTLPLAGGRSMVRFLLAVALSAVCAGAASAQLPPLQRAGPAPSRASNWVRIGTADNGQAYWWEPSSITIDTHRRARYRIDWPGWQHVGDVQVDCDGGLFQVISLETVSGVLTIV